MSWRTLSTLLLDAVRSDMTLTITVAQPLVVRKYLGHMGRAGCDVREVQSSATLPGSVVASVASVGCTMTRNGESNYDAWLSTCQVDPDVWRLGLSGWQKRRLVAA